MAPTAAATTASAVATTATAATTTATAAVLVAAVVVLVMIVAAAQIGKTSRFSIGHATPMVSSYDGQPYRVHRIHGSPEAAADMMALLNRRALSLMRWLRSNYTQPTAPAKARAITARLLRRYNPDNLAENSPQDPGGDTAYAVDKGSLLAICLRSKDTATLLGAEVLTFVLYHEMTHLAVDVLDHPPEFWLAFRFLLESAESAGIYTSPDFATTPRQYCGLKVDYNPRWDPSLPAFGGIIGN